MAKSSRASSRKANNQRLKANVFGPIESARNERLSARLLELAAAPKPQKAEDDEMKIVADEEQEPKQAEGKDECKPLSHLIPRPTPTRSHLVTNWKPALTRLCSSYGRRHGRKAKVE
jgi:hypothetical protein